MANINEAFPSDYLRAADLNGRTIKLTIADCVMEEIGRGRDASRKPVLYFKGAKKGLALNKTNSMTIAGAYGPETDDWVGAEIEVFPTMVDYQGKQVDAIRVKIPVRQVRQPEPPQRPRREDFADAEAPAGNAAPPRKSTLGDDDIPF